MNKREFLKTGVLGLGGLACSVCQYQSFATATEWLFKPSTGTGLWKWSREAIHYTTTPRGVKCLNCPNECTLKRGETSKCRNRINVADKLYTIAYGNPCAVHIDPVEKKPLFHFRPGSQVFSIATAGCNLACLNCQNWDISQSGPKETKNFDLMPAQVVDECHDNHCTAIAYTYSEPTTFYEYVYDTAILAHEKGIANIYKSNGYIQGKPLRQLCRYLDAANIDLKSFSESIYLKLNSGKLQPVLDSLLLLKSEGVWLEITSLVIPGYTDDMGMIRKMCVWLVKNGLSDCPLHFSRFSPMYKLTQLPSTPVSSLELARKTAFETGMKYVFIGNVPGTDFENTICPSCKKVVVERKGFRVLDQHLKGNTCAYCGTIVAGRW
jgi:pyruvate formate lyase activating enzyme